MSKKDEKGLVSKADNAGALPAHIKQGSARGMEHAKQDDFVFPRLAIAQATSPQILKTDSKHIPGLTPGDMYNTLSGKVYGPDNVTVVPILMWHQRLLFNPLTEGGGIRCRSNNGIDGGTECDLCAKCKYSQWGSAKLISKKEGDEGQACTAFTNYMAFVWPSGASAADRELINLSMKSTQLKVSKTLNSFIRQRQTDAFAGTYTLDTVAEQNSAKQTYYNFKIAIKGWADEDTYKEAEKVYDAWKDSLAVLAEKADVGAPEPEQESDFEKF